MDKPTAWQIAKNFITDGSVSYYEDSIDFEMTGTNYELYKYQCAANYIIPLEGHKVTGGYFFHILFKDIREVS